MLTSTHYELARSVHHSGLTSEIQVQEIRTPLSLTLTLIKEKRQPGNYLDAFILPSPPLQKNQANLLIEEQGG